MKKVFVATIVLCACAAAALKVLAPAKPQGAEIADFSLTDSRGQAFHLYAESQAKAIVLVSFGLGCPVIAKSLPVLAALRDKYLERGVEFVLLDSNLQDDQTQITEEAQRLHVAMPILMDKDQRVARALKIERQADALLIDPKSWRVLYRGMIDDSMDYGSEKPAANETYLANALEAYFSGQPITVARTTPIGCAIYFEGDHAAVE